MLPASQNPGRSGGEIKRESKGCVDYKIDHGRRMERVRGREGERKVEERGGGLGERKSGGGAGEGRPGRGREMSPRRFPKVCSCWERLARGVACLLPDLSPSEPSSLTWRAQPSHPYVLTLPWSLSSKVITSQELFKAHRHHSTHSSEATSHPRLRKGCGNTAVPDPNV